MACSVAAGGKIMLAAKLGKKVPTGWLLNSKGEPTDNPSDFQNGGMLVPIGDYKGYGMAIMLDILSGVLSGSAFGTGVIALNDFSTKQPLGTGHFMAAINIKHIIGLELFNKRMEQLIEEIKSCPKAEGIEEIMLPGERSERTYRERLQKGIPVERKVLEELKELEK